MYKFASEKPARQQLAARWEIVSASDARARTLEHATYIINGVYGGELSVRSGVYLVEVHVGRVAAGMRGGLDHSGGARRI